MITDFHKKLMEKSGFDEALVRHALDFSSDIDINEFTRLFFDTESFSVEKTGVLCFDEAFYPYEFYEKLKQLTIPPETASLYIFISLLETSYTDFTSRIEDDNIFFDTLKKLSESSHEYHKNNCRYGLYDYHFVANHIRGNILRLGTFEYQCGEYDGKKAIMLHLPENSDLSKEKRFESYKLARRYFGDFPIIADSWLLYPEHKKMLSKDSSIVDFMNDFDMIYTHETTDYSELFHVFGRLADYSYDNLPQNTSLQKAYAERIIKGMPIGSGVGVLRY